MILSKLNLRKFASNQNGYVAALFGLLALPMLGLIGGAMDYRSAGREQVKMRQAAEAAVIALVRSNYTPDSSITVEDETTLMTSVFNGNYVYNPGEVSNVDIKLTERDLVAKTYTVTVTAQVATTLLKMVGFDTLDIQVEAKAAAIFATENVEVFVFADVSPSMDAPDDGTPPPLKQTVYDPAGGGCFFACHYDGSVIRGIGKIPKWDVLQSWLSSADGLWQKVYDAAQANPIPVTATFGAGLFDQTLFSVGMYPDVTVARTSAAAPYTNGLHGTTGGTDLNTVFGDINTYLTTTNPKPPSTRRVIIIISDGAHSRAREPYNPASCTPIKANGDVYTFYVKNPISLYNNPNMTYQVPNSGGQYAIDNPDAWDLNTWENGGINTNNSRGYYSGTANAEALMRACATKPSMAFQGETGTQMRASLKAMTEAIIAPEIRIIN